MPNLLQTWKTFLREMQRKDAFWYLLSLQFLINNTSVSLDNYLDNILKQMY